VTNEGSDADEPSIILYISCGVSSYVGNAGRYNSTHCDMITNGRSLSKDNYQN